LHIGEKIKKLRTDKLMTQQELVGNQITRNMLSLIENGFASPSLETVRYLAGRLGVSAGFLLVEDDDDFNFRKLSNIVNIKKAFSASDYGICHQLCESVLKTPNGFCCDDEINFLLAESCLGLAREDMVDGKLYNAVSHIEEAIDNCSKTIYDTTYINVRANIYGKYINNISQMLYTDYIDDGFTWNDCRIMQDMFCRYISALFAIDEDEKAVEQTISQIEANFPYLSLHLRAKLLAKNGDYKRGAEEFSKLLNSSVALPETVVYELFGDLENCCRNTDDFKGAYEYSKSKITMLEHFISDREV